jgi:hypothetical protein
MKSQFNSWGQEDEKVLVGVSEPDEVKDWTLKVCGVPVRQSSEKYVMPLAMFINSENLVKC